VSRRILLVTYEFPPRGGPGVQRPVKFAKYWSREGATVDVLTVKDPVSAIVDESLLDELPDSVRIHRAWSLEPNRIARFGKRLLGRSAGGATAVRSPTRLTSAPRGLITAIQSLFVPDEKRFWVPWAVRRGRDLGRSGIDVVVSTGPPHTAHLVASRLARKWGVPHVVDLRDPWIGYLDKRYATSLHRRADLRLEARVIDRAAAVVSVTESMSREISARYPRLGRVVTVLNGYDTEDLQDVVPAERSDSKVRFIHAGTFSGNRRPDEFLRGLARAEAAEECIAQDAEVVFVGAGSEIEDTARSLGVRARVRALGYLDHGQALSELAAADVALVLLSEGRESEISLTGKLFEYLGLRKPILGVVGAGEVESLLESEQGCWLARPSDSDAVAQAIVEIHRRWRDGGLLGPSRELTQRFSRAAQADEYLALLDEIVEEQPGPG